MNQKIERVLATYFADIRTPIGKKVSPESIQEFKEKLKDYWESQGYLNVSVNVSAWGAAFEVVGLEKEFTDFKFKIVDKETE